MKLPKTLITIILASLTACAEGDPTSLKPTETEAFYVCELASGQSGSTLKNNATLDTKCVSYQVEFKPDTCELTGKVRPVWCHYTWRNQPAFDNFDNIDGVDCKEVSDIQADFAYGIEGKKKTSANNINLSIVSDPMEDRVFSVQSIKNEDEICQIDAFANLYPSGCNKGILSQLDKMIYVQEDGWIIPDVTHAWLTGYAVEKKCDRIENDLVIEYHEDP